MKRHLQWRSISLLVTALGCTSTETRYPTSAADTTSGGGIARATLHVTVRADAEAAAAASALGWAGGTIPQAIIRITRAGSAGSLEVAADQAGAAIIPDLLPGTYSLTVFRVLNEQERGVVQAAGFGLDGFAGGVGTWVSAPNTSLNLPISPGERGSLVISEVLRADFLTPNVGFYRDHQYIELYNNSDTTIYLDRKIIGKGTAGAFDYPRFPCSLYAPFTLDSLGIWATYFYQVPGSGTIYPLLPGTAAVIALDAIDHSQINPKSPDLRFADFETIGRTDTDNPSVPNLVFVGAAEDDPGGWRGMLLWELSSVIFVANDFVKDTLPTMVHPSNRTYHRIGRGAFLDLISHRIVFAAPLSPPCETIVLPIHDRRPGELLRDTDELTLKRKVLFTAPNGRTVLQRTRATQVDFEAVPLLTPGAVP